MEKLNFWVDRPGYSKNFTLMIGTLSGFNRAIAKPVEFEVVPEQGYLGHKPPALELTPTDAQALMDELYRAGIRPTFMENSEGALAATEKHLKDMREIAFGLLGASKQEKAE